ncbi:MAG: dTMP kinase [Azorhizobium sp. 12-66-6]|nr:MAG: dTMP kinase [Azorhizobium sp. 12-66-6]
MTAARGRFISLEGGEGTGKSTQARILAAALETRGVSVRVTREPGGSPFAEKVREVLLSGLAQPLGPQGEAALFAAARADHVRETIAPALEAGTWVICDRKGAAADRFEREGADYHAAIRAAFLALSGAEPERCVVIDARGDVESVAAQILSAVSARLALPTAAESAPA